MPDEPPYPIRPVVHADGTPVSYADIEAAIRSAPYIPYQKPEHLRRRETGRLNLILARAFYREGWHGGFW